MKNLKIFYKTYTFESIYLVCFGWFLLLILLTTIL